LASTFIRPDGFESDEVDDRGEFVLDAVIKLVQKGSSLQCGRIGQGIGHGGSPDDNSNYTV
jgi:hypothetical protein